MTKRSDLIALRPIQVPVRPFYALGVLLDADDFFGEQSYHRGRAARAFKYLFGTGTAAGLEVVWREAEQQLAVNPGLALQMTTSAFGGTKVKLIGRGSKLFRPGSDAETIAAARDSAPLQQTPNSLLRNS